MIHHVGIEVSDLERSSGFYDALLAPLGWWRHVDSRGGVGWGMAKPVFFITARESARPGNGHVCFEASGIAAVKAAWEAGIDAGASDDGRPGGRPEYGPGYYSAYLRDPDGWRLEIAVASE